MQGIQNPSTALDVHGAQESGERWTLLDAFALTQELLFCLGSRNFSMVPSSSVSSSVMAAAEGCFDMSIWRGKKTANTDFKTSL